MTNIHVALNMSTSVIQLVRSAQTSAVVAVLLHGALGDSWRIVAVGDEAVLTFPDATTRPITDTTLLSLKLIANPPSVTGRDARYDTIPGQLLLDAQTAGNAAIAAQITAYLTARGGP